jgi:hypothetical protein
LLFGHIVIFIPLFGITLYYFKDDLVSGSVPWLSHIIFFIFLFQTMLIVTKRLKNEDFFSPKSYMIFPLKKITIYLYSLIFGIIDLNVILLLSVSLGILIFTTDWSLLVKLVFFTIFILSEITYLIIMMIIIEIMTNKYGNSKNLMITTFLLFMLLEQFTRFAEKFYLFDFYPISGWIGSTVLASIRGDFIPVLFYMGLNIVVALIGVFVLDKIFFPKKNYM